MEDSFEILKSHLSDSIYLAPLHAIHLTGYHFLETALGLYKMALHQDCPFHPLQI